MADVFFTTLHEHRKVQLNFRVLGIFLKGFMPTERCFRMNILLLSNRFETSAKRKTVLLFRIGGRGGEGGGRAGKVRK